MVQNLKSLFKKAAAIAAEVPEPMQNAAFSRALDALVQQQELALGQSPNAPQPTSTGSRQKREPEVPSNNEDLARRLTDGLDRTRHPEIANASTALEQSLRLLRAARDDLDVDGLTPPQIAQVLRDKFRLPTSPSAISHALADAGDMVDRHKTGNAFVYRIMAPGETHLDSLEASPQPAGRRTRMRKAQARRRSKPAGKPPAREGRKASGRSRSLGPKAMVESLIETGFFTQGRTVSQIQNHLENTEGRLYKATDLSPALLRLLRDDKKLARHRNDDGQYEYRAR